jgi:hypothetical protein
MSSHISLPLAHCVKDTIDFFKRPNESAEKAFQTDKIGAEKIVF